ncbi:uncharacterized protein LOC127711356 [Mytilus californianus]|uniref:uncharacterized protein LOC127711356 n=1 Tax=Mytilus californianus TaxID=6549 RepID=UPI002247539C|nr:uncharacterized protein LOC127711356 [Mytilus californianus]XP_052073346.1 uncharacterized protein LOC127711356 [Mytilus californianus]
MEETIDEIKIYSITLDNILETVGASEYVRRTQQHRSIMQELLISATRNITGSSILKMYTYKFGSAIEGTTTPGLNSDQDCLICVDRPPVIEEISEKGLTEYLLMITDENTPPGYTKLQHVVNNEPMNLEEMEDEDEEIDITGNRVLGNRFLIESMTNDEINGPAGTTLKSKQLPGVPDLDFVPSYRCRTWPRQALSWLSRQRSSGFPNAEMIGRFTSHGCFLVPVGQYVSPEKRLQWKLSFSFQERQIMFSMSPIQFKTFISLKMIKKNFIKDRVPPKSLTSYHCKTCMFYIMETSPSNIWTSDNLVQCISMCLQKLLQWFENGFIPSYFIPEENLWKGNTDTRETIVDILGSLLETSPIYLTEIKCDSVGIFLQNALPSSGISKVIDNISAIQADLEQSQRELDRFIYKSHMWTLDYIIKCAKELIIFAADEELDKCITLHNAIIQRMCMDSDPRLVLEHTSLDRRMASAYILPFLQTSLGSQLSMKYLHTHNNTEKEHLWNESMKFLTKGIESDSMSGQLKLATILFMIDRTEDSKEMLDRIDETFDPKFFNTHCGCSKESDYVCVALRNSIREEKLSTLEILRKYTGVCVCFLRTEKDIVPKHLHYEMFRSVFSETPRKPYVDDWFDSAAVDSDIFLFYMLFRVNQKLGNYKAMTISKLSLLMEMERNVNLTHVDTAQNLLGCLFKESGDLDLAWQCFMASWAFRPDHNAAKWHMAIMLYEGITCLGLCDETKIQGTEERNEPEDEFELIYSRL